MTLTSSELSEKLNRLGLRKGAFFLPASPEHLDRIVIANPEVLVHTNYRDVVVNQISHCTAVTAFDNVTPVAIFGFVPVWKGVTESWLLVDDKARALPIALTKYGIAVHDIAKISMDLHRQQITVRITDKRAYKWALALGFEIEATMRKYGPDGIDYYLMARF
jgi:hypothetical protein